MPNLKLDPRLSAVASLIRPGSVILDIGTDHAYLPVFLVEQGICPRAIASDLRIGPLENARTTIALHNCADKIETRLSDGLDAFAPGCCDTVVLAGMGGLLIAELLGRTPWLADPAMRVIAQPMSHAEDVRSFFFTHGFMIDQEICTADQKHLYCVMAASFTGKTTEVTPALPYVGTLPQHLTPLAEQFLQRQAERLKKRRDALLAARGQTDEVDALDAILADFQRYYRPKEHTI